MSINNAMYKWETVGKTITYENPFKENNLNKTIKSKFNTCLDTIDRTIFNFINKQGVNFTFVNIYDKVKSLYNGIGTYENSRFGVLFSNNTVCAFISCIGESKCTSKDKFNVIHHCESHNDKMKKFHLFYKVKVVNFEDSSKLFGYKGCKSKMKDQSDSGEFFTITDFLDSYKCEKDGVYRNILEVKNSNKSYKFTEDEIELIPDFSKLDLVFKGYNAPKDTKIKKGSKVRLVRNQKINLPHNVQLKVDGIVAFGEKKFASVTYEAKNYMINMKKLRKI